MLAGTISGGVRFGERGLCLVVRMGELDPFGVLRWIRGEGGCFSSIFTDAAGSSLRKE